MTPEENKAIILRYLDETWNKHNLAIIDEVIAEDFVHHIKGVPPGRDGIHRFFPMIYAVVPDAHFTVEDIIAEGDKVVWRFTVRGIHSGPLRGIAATGRPIEQSGIAITRMSNGQMKENWNQTDDLGLMQQLGVIPAR